MKEDWEHIAQIPQGTLVVLRPKDPVGDYHRYEFYYEFLFRFGGMGCLLEDDPAFQSPVYTIHPDLKNYVVCRNSPFGEFCEVETLLYLCYDNTLELMIADEELQASYSMTALMMS